MSIREEILGKADRNDTIMEYTGAFKEIVEFIESNDDFLITTHYSPDGDAIGSCLGMSEMLKFVGKRSLVAIEGGLPEKYDFLNIQVPIVNPQCSTGDRKYGNVIILDAGTFERIGACKFLLEDDSSIINIDHHLSNDEFGLINYIDVASSSVSEILFRLAKHMGVEFSSELATYLYLGIMTDTGRFRFSNTTPSALRTAGALVEAGADPSWLSDGIYYNLSRNYITALGQCLNNLEYYNGGSIALMQYMNKQELEDVEGLIDYVVGIRGVKVAAFLRAMEDGRFKVSLRSRCEVDVRRIAESFGGGGHQKAAGFRYRGSLNDLKIKVIQLFSQQLN